MTDWREVLREGAMAAAPKLLGAIIQRDDGRAGHIVEVEAYHQDDPASHSCRGERPRNRAMFGEPGIAYVYQIYGIYYCFNIVAGPPGRGEAVLIRALEPMDGMDAMDAAYDKPRARTSLCRGPGLICRAFGIDRRLDGVDLLDAVSPLRLLAGKKIAASEILTTPRIGMTVAVDEPLRFCVANHPAVSGPGKWRRK